MEYQARDDATANSRAEDEQKPALTPTLVIGLGGTGTQAVRYLKRRLVWLWRREAIEIEMDQIPPGENVRRWHQEVWRRHEMLGGPPLLQLLAVDTWPWGNRAGEVYLNEHEYAYIGGYNATRVLQHKERHPEIDAWWGWQNLRAGQIHSGARQLRPLGRLSIFRRYRAFMNKLQPQIERIKHIDARQKTEDRGYQVAPTRATKRVYIISSVCGGTGAGIFLDVAATVRAQFGESAIITGIFALPSVFIPDLQSDLQKERVQANAYAALKEINYFQGNPYPWAMPGEQPRMITPMFNRLYLVERSNTEDAALNSIEDVQKLIANQVFLESITDVGLSIWEYDVNITMERRTKEDQEQSYIFSSFANSSLLVPSDDMREYTELKYAEHLIQGGVLRQPLPAEQNELTSYAVTSLAYLRDLTGGEGLGGEEEEYEDEDEYEDEGGVGVSTDEEALPDPNAPLKRLQKDTTQVLQKYGLRGGEEYLRNLRARVEGELRAAREAEESDRNSATRAREALRNFDQHRPFLANLDFWPVSIFTGNIARRRRQARQRLELALAQAEGMLRESQYQREVWARLHDNIEPLHTQLVERIKMVEAVLVQQVQEDMKLLFDTTRVVEHQPFEMFTMILGKDYIENQLYPMVLSAGLRQQLSADTARALDKDAVASVKLVTAEQEAEQMAGRYPDVLRLVPTDTTRMARAIEAIARDSARRYLREEMFHIRSIVQSDNNRIKGRLHDLFARCQPFWRYDLDIGGHSENDMEEIVLVGLPEKENRDWTYLLRDFPNFTAVETNDPNRIDACRVVHGLPVEYLEALPEMRAKYESFVEEQMGPMQLDARWERGSGSGQELPDISPAMEISMAPAGNGQRAEEEQRAAPVETHREVERSEIVTPMLDDRLDGGFEADEDGGQGPHAGW